MKSCQVHNLKYNFISNIVNTDVLDIFIDGDIVDAPTQEFYKNWWGDETSTSYRSFRDAVNNSTAKTKNFHINSGGGMMADAFAIHDFIEEGIANGKDWHTYGKGMVCSAATYILLAGGKNMHISKNCYFMIHNAAGSVSGQVDEIESYAVTIRKFNDTARNLYADKFSKPKETISQWMNKETWWTGQEMCDMGLISADNLGPAVNAITNSIPKEKWPFQNMAVLNTINNSVSKPKNKDMKLTKIGNAIAESIKNALTEAGVIKDSKVGSIDLTAFQNSVTNGINTALESLETEMSTEITNGIADGLKGDVFNTAVANAVKNVIATEGNAITLAINSATSGFAKAGEVVNKTEFETMKNDVATKLGTQTVKNTRGGAGSKPEAEAIEETEGVTWNVRKD